ncbi:MAG: FG-GAP-like repeat-containing protein [Gemmatimonadaceae bacterium]
MTSAILVRRLVPLIGAAALGCGAHAAPSKDGTAMMADTLAHLSGQALFNPMQNPFMNGARARYMRARLSRQIGKAVFQARFLYANELLLAGETREAIAEFETLQDDARLALNPRVPESKAFFDRLGIAYLRLGEQENCALNPSASVCILPLDGAARHVREEGARKAIEVYQRILEAFPDDVGTRYLLNLAYLALGEHPHRVPERWLIPNLSLRRQSGFPVFYNVANDVGLGIEGLAGGLCVEDFNGDGHLDLFTTAWGLNDGVRLFLADGQGGYIDATSKTGLTGIVGGLNCVHADYDNDGHSDILITRGAWLGSAGDFPNSLLRNRGDGTFADVTYAAGLGSRHPTQSAAWADFNLDGSLDLFVGNESTTEIGGPAHRSELYVNNGDGTFSEISAKAGIDVEAFVKGVTWGDVNNDGLPDLYLSVLFGRNKLFLNRGDGLLSGWRFEEAAAAAGVERPIASFPTWFWDYDNDGWEDLLVLGYDSRDGGDLHEAVGLEYLGQPPTVRAANGARVPVEPSRLYRNKGDGTFEDVTSAAGLDGKAIFAMGSNFGDLDNDGILDFYVGTGNPDLRSVIPNRMFRGSAAGGFREVTLEGGFAHIQKGHATAFADFDRDGDADVFMVMGGAFEGDRFRSVLFENPGWNDRSWIALELEGRQANRSAIGARVEIVAVDSAGVTRAVHRTIGTGGSFGAGSLSLHVGLGSAVRVKEVRITWPDGDRSRNVYADLPVRRTFRIVQGETPVQLDRPAVAFRREGAASPHDH